MGMGDSTSGGKGFVSRLQRDGQCDPIIYLEFELEQGVGRREDGGLVAGGWVVMPGWGKGGSPQSLCEQLVA